MNVPLSTSVSTPEDLVAALDRYLSDVLLAGTANERTVARTASHLLAPIRASLTAHAGEPTDEQMEQIADAIWGAQKKRLPMSAAIEFARAVLALSPPPLVAPVGDAGWISAEGQLPDVPVGGKREFIVAVKRRHNGKTYVFSADYLNAHLLCTSEDDCPEDGTPFTGWFHERSDDSGEFDTCFMPVLSEGDVLTHFQPLPAAPKTPQE